MEITTLPDPISFSVEDLEYLLNVARGLQEPLPLKIAVDLMKLRMLSTLEKSKQEKLKTTVDKLALSVRTYHCLKNAGITTVGELINKDESELLKLRLFGRVSLNEIKDNLASMSLSLKP